MEPLESMKKRSKAFKEGFPKATVINDSRFGIRKFFLRDQEKAKKGVYMDPGRGANGESAS
jgi:hypothetical protein